MSFEMILVICVFVYLIVKEIGYRHDLKFFVEAALTNLSEEKRIENVKSAMKHLGIYDRLTDLARSVFSPKKDDKRPAHEPAAHEVADQGKGTLLPRTKF